MNKPILSKLLITLALFLYLITGFLIYAGHDKMTNYLNSENLQINAYVGGDAYNYIINGTYTTGFFALASGTAVSGTICLCTGLVATLWQGQENQFPDFETQEEKK